VKLKNLFWIPKVHAMRSTVRPQDGSRIREEEASPARTPILQANLQQCIVNHHQMWLFELKNLLF
jgi:hypothetical protein